MPTFFILSEYLINALETFLVYYFFKRVLGFRKAWPYQLFFCLLNWFFVGLVHLWKIDLVYAQLLYFLCLQMGVHFLCRGRKAFRFFVASLPQIFAISASSILISLAGVLRIPINESFTAGPMRFYMSVLYLISISTIYFIAIRWLTDKKSQGELSFSPASYLGIVSVFLSALLAWILIFQLGIKQRAVADISSIILLYLLLTLFLISVFSIFKLGRERKIHEEQQFLLYKAKLEKCEYDQLKSLRDFLSQSRHDLRNHNILLTQLISSGKSDEALRLLSDDLKELDLSALRQFTASPIANAIIETQALLAKNEGINFEFETDDRHTFPLRDRDIFSLLSNLLTNAREAALLSPDPRCVRLEIFQRKANCYIRVKNSSNGHYQKDEEGQLVSNKSEMGHGLGLKIIDKIIKKYHAVQLIETESSYYSVTMLFPLPEGEAKTKVSVNGHTEEV